MKTLDVRCMDWTGGTRCERMAVGYLITDDGKPCPGGYICQECADACISEYREKLGETWTTVALDEYGQPVMTAPPGWTTVEEHDG